MAELSVDDVEAAEKARCQGFLAGDRTLLEDVFADDFVYVHSTGRREERESFLSTSAGSDNRFLSITNSDVKVDLLGSVALMTGTIDLVRMNGASLSRFVQVWLYAGKTWKLKFHQVTRKAS